jgi:hypothetical protein
MKFIVVFWLVERLLYIVAQLVRQKQIYFNCTIYKVTSRIWFLTILFFIMVAVSSDCSLLFFF